MDILLAITCVLLAAALMRAITVRTEAKVHHARAEGKLEGIELLREQLQEDIDDWLSDVDRYTEAAEEARREL